MNLKGLWLKEWLLLCGRAEQACVDGFRGLAERATDKKAKDLVRKITEEEERHLREIRRLDDRTPWPIVCHVDERAIEGLLRHHFPTLRAAPAESDRASVLRFARSVEEESARFYRTLALLAPDRASERFFRKIADREDRHLQVLSS